jgi:hypothetical protein
MPRHSFRQTFLNELKNIIEQLMTIFFRCLRAIHSFHEQVIILPNIIERRKIAQRVAIASNRKLESLIGFIDGTLLPIGKYSSLHCTIMSEALKPEFHGEDYMQHKKVPMLLMALLFVMITEG